MEILQATVLNFDTESNLNPRILALVDTIPSEGFVFEDKDGVYRAVKDGLVRHFRYSGPSESGAVFEAEMESGEVRSINGSWAISAPAVSVLFEPCVAVTITDNPGQFDAGQGYEASFTVNKALEALRCVGSDTRQGLQAQGHVLIWNLRAQYGMSTGELYIEPFLAKDVGGTPELYIGELAMQWMGGLDQRYSAATTISAVASRLWDTIKLIRAVGLPLVEQTTMRENARILSQLAASLTQERPSLDRSMTPVTPLVGGDQLGPVTPLVHPPAPVIDLDAADARRAAEVDEHVFGTPVVERGTEFPDVDPTGGDVPFMEDD